MTGNELFISRYWCLDPLQDVSQRKIRFTSTHSPKDLFDKIENAVKLMGFQAQRGHSKVDTQIFSHHITMFDISD